MLIALALSFELGFILLITVYGVDIPYETIGSIILGIGSIVVAISTIVLALTAHSTSKISRRQSHVTAISEVLRDVGNPEIRKSRKELYKYGRENDIVVPIPLETIESDPSLGQHIEDVAVSFDRVGLIVDDDEQLRRKVLKLIGHNIVDCWTMSSQYLDYLDKARRTTAWNFFRELANHAMKNSNPQPEEKKTSKT